MTTRRLVAAAAIAATALFGTGCSLFKAEPISGTVIGKDYDQGGCKSVKQADGTRKTKCTSAEYELDIREDDGDYREVDVDRSTFDRTQVGQRFTRN